MPRLELSLSNCLPICDSQDREILCQVIEKSFDEGGCRIWCGYMDKDKYPVYWHQYAGWINLVPFIYRTFIDSTLPRRRQVKQACDNIHCIHPGHLALKVTKRPTQADRQSFKEKWNSRIQRTTISGDN